MAPSTASSGALTRSVSMGEEGGADFLRRLSVADAKVLLERTRKEKENKTTEMQKMIGVRYRDLIESADKIVTMHSAAMRLETTLKEMPDKWKTMEAQLASTLAASSSYVVEDDDEVTANGSREVNNRIDEQEASVQERVLFLVRAFERLWLCIDRGTTYEALLLFKQVKKVYASLGSSEALERYPFLPSMWASIQTFEERMISTARLYLESRGKSANFYASNLVTVAELHPNMRLDDLINLFLNSRVKWLELESRASDHEDDAANNVVVAGRELRLNLRSAVLTVLHAEEIFLGNSSTPLSEMNHPLRELIEDEIQKDEVLETITNKIARWLDDQIEKIRDHAAGIINGIESIAQIAQSQSKLVRIDGQYAEYRETTLWKAVCQRRDAPASSMFELLFGSAFRKQTRALVQHLFVEALDAIKSEIRVCVGVPGDDARQSLRKIRFYELFDTIHKRVGRLDSAELQRVLTEEYLRILLRLVVFLDAEYPSAPLRSESQTTSGPSYFFALSNILTAIVCDFPSRMAALFGVDRKEVSPFPPQTQAKHRTIFLQYAENEHLSQLKAKEAIQAALAGGASNPATFIDIELKSIQSLSFFGFYLASSVKHNIPYADIFVGVLQGLANGYCEAWAKHWLRHRIEPLREVLMAEQYNQTNEEWISSHEGWSEQVIVDELVDHDEDGELELTTSEEKVWLPWCETPTVSNFLFSCCYALDDAYRRVRTTEEAGAEHVRMMREVIRHVLVEQLTIMSVEVYDEAVNMVIEAKSEQSRGVLNFGECCVQQFLFDMYFVRATLGFSDFVRFGWGDEINPDTCSPSLARLKQLFDRMRDFIDPVDWEIYGPQLIENVVIQFRKSRLLFSSLSESSDISEINGKPIVISAQDTRPMIKIAEPVPRFSLLPVPSSRRRVQREAKPVIPTTQASSTSASLFHESTPADTSGSGTLPSLKLQNILSTSAGSNILSAAATGSNLLSSAAKGMSFLSSATSSYLREGESRTKYF
ncbi:hypothetical protein Poli38472_002327 [Pythium oligandrum]|uniref:Conserved oligomeric Golgi complex subunit 1 n=1 Tax=Pythium oligandrum TaxID=41045 RepID=A0A8K1CIH8_PYTOL|nr:hypothetical protein Poli38472_002327 [Pythium oligandrum]|eukprot:TMW63386.1 hypothetical protein Poli38472_002327 [Pythium oligandrum]